MLLLNIINQIFYLSIRILLIALKKIDFLKINNNIFNVKTFSMYIIQGCFKCFNTFQNKNNVKINLKIKYILQTPQKHPVQYFRWFEKTFTWATFNFLKLP